MRLYQEVTDKIVRQLESGDVPMWLKPWKVSTRNGADLLPANTVNYRDTPQQFRGPYRSIASVTLMIAREMTREILQRQPRMAAPMEDRHAA